MFIQLGQGSGRIFVDPQQIAALADDLITEHGSSIRLRGGGLIFVNETPDEIGELCRGLPELSGLPSRERVDATK